MSDSVRGILLVCSMRSIVLFGLILATALLPRAYAIVDPMIMYRDTEKRIAEIKDSRAQISDALVSVHLAKADRRQLREWEKSLDEEQGILEKRLELFKKLQGSGIITYVTPEEKNLKNESEISKKMEKRESPK